MRGKPVCHFGLFLLKHVAMFFDIDSKSCCSFFQCSVLS